MPARISIRHRPLVNKVTQQRPIWSIILLHNRCGWIARRPVARPGCDILASEIKLSVRKSSGATMLSPRSSRRDLMKAVGALAGGSLLSQTFGCRQPAAQAPNEAQPGGPADYTLTIAVKPVELAPNRIVSTTTYNGQFPGPLLRFQEGKPVTIDIHNQTDTPEQLHWHGQFVSTGVDGSSEEGTPFIPAHGSRRITFTPKPSGYRFYHTHVRAADNLSSGQYTGLVGPVYI